jgi:hypothetical protein
VVDRWFEGLRSACEAACAPESGFGAEVVLFYAARWCQKRARAAEPDPAPFREEAPAVAARIVRNLGMDGARLDRLFEGDRREWTSLRRLLLASAAARVPHTAGENADEALSKIAVVIFTGTPPSRAVQRLAEGPEGPGNEYIFISPFENWARAVVINHIIDEVRRAKRDRRLGEKADPGGAPDVDPGALAWARDSLKALISAIEALPRTQRSVMVASLCRQDVDEAVHDELHEIAPELFVHGDDRPSSDGEIARTLGTTAHRLAANRSAARRKLARQDAMWGLILDGMLPHRSTKRIGASTGEAEPATEGGGSE